MRTFMTFWIPRLTLGSGETWECIVRVPVCAGVGVYMGLNYKPCALGMGPAPGFSPDLRETPDASKFR